MFENIPNETWIHIAYLLIFVVMALILTKESKEKWKALDELSAKDSVLLLATLALDAGRDLIDELHLKVQDKDQEYKEAEDDYMTLVADQKKFAQQLIEHEHREKGYKQSMRQAEETIREQRRYIEILENESKTKGKEIRALRGRNTRLKKTLKTAKDFTI